jgi:hypothetical protein
VLRQSLTIRPLTQEDADADSKATGHPDASAESLGLGGLAMAGLLVLAVFALIARPTNSTDESASPGTTSSKPEATTTSTSTIDTRDEVVARFKQIFRIRDEAIRTRNPLPLEEVYTVDCPCLKGDQELIRKLRQEGAVMARDQNISRCPRGRESE